MAEGICFKAIVHGVKIDRLGEVRLVLEVPKKHRDQALLCGALTEMIVDVEITPSKDQMVVGAGKRKPAEQVDI